MAFPPAGSHPARPASARHIAPESDHPREQGDAGPDRSWAHPVVLPVVSGSDERPTRLVPGLPDPVIATPTVAALIAVTWFTGLPGPGPMRRYPVADLQRLADRVNRSALDGPNALCFNGRGDPATVDVVHSRVSLTSSAPFPLSSDELDMVDGTYKRFVIVACDGP